MRKFPIMKICMGLALAFCLAGTGLSQTGVQRVLASPDVPIQFENPAGAPLLIQDANTKVITNAEYHQLVGLTRDIGANSSSHYTTYPTVTLVNNTDQRMTGFALLLKKPGEETHFVQRYGITIEPYQTYTIEYSTWRPAKTLPDLRMPYMWLPGDASDLVVKMGVVHFENGGKWITPY